MRCASMQRNRFRYFSTAREPWPAIRFRPRCCSRHRCGAGWSTPGAHRWRGRPGRTAAELAGTVGLHVTTVRFHLDQLVAAGLVESAVRREGGAGRPRKVYTVAPGSLDDVDARAEVDHLRLLSGLLASTDLDLRDRGVWAARRPRGGRSSLGRGARLRPRGPPPADTPGRWLGKLAQMIDVLQEWGYTPELRTSDGGRVAGSPWRTAPSATWPGRTPRWSAPSIAG